MTKLGTTPLAAAPEPGAISADFVVAGPPIPALDRLKLFSDSQWEDFILEWADSLRSDYERVEKCGGAGDMGRDVVAYVTDQDGPWDNFQCKKYVAPLQPNHVWIELGKLVYFTKIGAYTYPRRYFFIAPQGAGNALSSLLKKPESLREGLLKNWQSHCRTAITSTAAVELDADMRNYIGGLDFSIFDATPPLKIIDAHAKTRWHVARFGGGLPARPQATSPPSEVGALETVFVRELLAAYGDHLKKPLTAVTDLAGSVDLVEHFADSRREFYSAESLRTFSRDTLPPGEFERLQDEVHDGIRDEVRLDHPSGYHRVVTVVKTARALDLGGHPLHTRMTVRDRGGVCHQLVNDGRVRWVK